MGAENRGSDRPKQRIQRPRTRHTIAASSSTSMSNATLVACFGAEEDMEIESPIQSLKKLLATKNKEKQNIKRPRDRNTQTPSPTSKCTPEAVHSAEPAKDTHRSLWFGFEAMEKLAKENGQEPLFYEETIEDRVTRGVSRIEATKLDQVSISFPRIPQMLYPSKRPDGVPGQHYNLTQVPSETPLTLLLVYLWISKFQFIFNCLTHHSFTTMLKKL